MNSIESLAVVTIASVLVTAATPPLQRTLDTNRRAAEVNRLVSGIQLARNEALRRHTGVSICPTLTGESCGGPTDWKHGWMIVSDRHSTAMEILYVHQPKRQVQLLSNRKTFTFNPPHRRSTNGTITVCGRHGATAIIVSHMGRPRLQRGASIDARCV